MFRVWIVQQISTKLSRRTPRRSPHYATLSSPRFHRSIAPSVSPNKVSTTIYLISQSLQLDAKNVVT